MHFSENFDQILTAFFGARSPLKISILRRPLHQNSFFVVHPLYVSKRCVKIKMTRFWSAMKSQSRLPQQEENISFTLFYLVFESWEIKLLQSIEYARFFLQLRLLLYYEIT